MGRAQTWRHEDTLLACALEAYEATRVNELGIPKRVAEDPQQARRFIIEETPVDYALKRLDEWKTAQKKTKRELPAGVRAKVTYKPAPPRKG